MYSVQYDHHIRSAFVNYVRSIGISPEWQKTLGKELGISISEVKRADETVIVRFPSEDDYLMFMLKYS